MLKLENKIGGLMSRTRYWEKKTLQYKNKIYRASLIYEKLLLAVKKSISNYLEMAESPNSMRSVNSIGKVDFAWSGIIENLNGKILFAAFVEFFE